ncbi:MAG: glycosyltransferase family 39 protein, partial [Chlorobi bacterium]|nr:glycosyltransferase family 39 protein [Chlorobiota bacterium]
MRKTYFPKLFSTGDFKLNPEILNKTQIITFWAVVVFTVIGKLILISYNMMDMGDSATRVWNALWWAQNPFFIMPESGHPFWFYFMGPIIMATGEIYYTSIITMIILMTIANIYIFKTTLMLSDFKTALIAFIIVTLNPVIFRLNFEPYAQQTYLASFCILVYYFIKAVSSEESKKYFIIAGIFAFIALFSRPEAIFVLAPLCVLASLTKKRGNGYFISLALVFQVIWIAISLAAYGTLFQTIESADQYTDPVNIEGLNLGLRLKGFFLPYYFLVLGLTIIIFYYFIKGLIYFYKKYPNVILITLLIPVLFPALANGAAGAKSTVYHTTHYIYLMFLISPIFCAIGLNIDLGKFKSAVLKYVIASLVIISCIPLSYVKEFVPEQNNKLFPKIIQFIVTSDEPEESRKLIKFIDENINSYPALIFDADDNASSILYIPFRTKLAPREKIMISSYNIPRDKEGLLNEIKSFMKINPKIIIMTRKSPTLMNQIFTEITIGKKYIR